MVQYRVLTAAAACLALAACATVYNLPLNKPSANPFARSLATEANGERRSDPHSVIIGLSFSGGGTRASAFSFGVLQQLARTKSPRTGRPLIEDVGIISAVSGGSITAAYYGLKGEAALTDFRERFLTQDMMAQLNTSINLINVSRALDGGVNTDNRVRDWLNDHLYGNATFGDLLARRRPIVLINATDIYSRTPFLFSPLTFSALCSDITEYPIAGAVAASAAVPGAFAPIVVETFPGQCHTPLPEGMIRAANAPGASPQLHAFAQALERARTGQVKYVKLFDGGLADNYGLSGITIARASSLTPYGPMRPEEAVSIRRLLFVVVDAGRGPQGNWSQTLEGPTGKDLVGAVIDTVIDANTRSSYTAFEATMKNWREELIRWRCHLKREEVAKLRADATGPWNCRDLKFTIARVSFEELGGARAAELNKVPTSFTLPTATVDALIQAGADALEANQAYQEFRRDM